MIILDYLAIASGRVFLEAFSYGVVFQSKAAALCIYTLKYTSQEVSCVQLQP
jgi:hypothetical protein